MPNAGMNQNKPTLVILAAGLGSRFGGLKQIEPVGPSGELIIEYSIYDAMESGFGRVVCVIRDEMHSDCSRILRRCTASGIQIEYAFQSLNDIPAGFIVPPSRKKQWGTAHAVYAARQVVHEPFAVINADDFYGRQSYRLLSDFLSAADPAAPDFALAAFELRRTLSANGGVSRGICQMDQRGMLARIKECHGVERAEGQARYMEDDQSVALDGGTPVSMNMWGFTPVFFDLAEKELKNFLNRHAESDKAECYIPLVIDALLCSAEASVKCLLSNEQWYGITHPEDRPEVIRGINELIGRGFYPSPLWR